MNTIDIIREFYDGQCEFEWNRIAGRPEFLLTCRMLDRYIRPGDSVLDIGGGPGRYSLHLAQKGCDVTLLDLSPNNADFAMDKARELGLSIKAQCGDARFADSLLTGAFDHVLLMGPMYHLLEEADRVTAMNAALRLLKPGGVIYVSFINIFAGLIYAMKFKPEAVIDPNETPFMECIYNGISYAGTAFTQAFFIQKDEMLPFMARFPLEKLHFFGQEGITSPCEQNLTAQPEVAEAWLDLSERLWERDDLLNYSEHLMYVGRKK